MWLSFAKHEPVNFGAGAGMGTGRRRAANNAIVWHTNGAGCGSVKDLYGWFSSGGAGPYVGAHGQVALDGTVYQYVDTAYTIGHAWAANSWAVGWETQDYGDCKQTGWTAAQLASMERICRALHIPAVILPDHAANGVGWHQEFYDWNKNDHNCPFPVRIQQIRSELIPALRGGGEDFLAALTDAQQREMYDALHRLNDGGGVAGDNMQFIQGFRHYTTNKLQGTSLPVTDPDKAFMAGVALGKKLLP